MLKILISDREHESTVPGNINRIMSSHQPILRIRMNECFVQYKNGIVQEFQDYLRKTISNIAQDYSLNEAELITKYGTIQLEESLETQPEKATPDLGHSDVISSDDSTSKSKSSKRKNTKAKKKQLPKKKRAKLPVDPSTICMARKQDGNQCTRRKKEGQEYCGKHIKNRKYGRIDEPSPHFDKKLSKNSNYLATKIEKINGVEYLVDDNNVVYHKNISKPSIVGVKVDSNTLCPLEKIQEDLRRKVGN